MPTDTHSVHCITACPKIEKLSLERIPIDIDNDFDWRRPPFQINRVDTADRMTKALIVAVDVVFEKIVSLSADSGVNTS